MTAQTETELRKALHELATEVAEKAAEIVRIDAAARAMLAALEDMTASRAAGYDLPWGTVAQAIAKAKAAGIK